MTLHVTTGTFTAVDPNPYLTHPAGTVYDDLSIHGLALLYGVSDYSIQMENFGGTSRKFIYEWLSTHGGKRQTADPSQPTGYHWSFQPGMGVAIPGDMPSLSPPPSDEPVTAAGPATGASEESSGVDVVVAESDYSFAPIDLSDESTTTTPTAAKKAGVGGGLMGLLVIGVGIFALTKLFGAKTKKGRGRKTGGRRRR